MSLVKPPGPGTVGLVMSVIGTALQFAYKDSPLVIAGAKWLVWVGVALLLWWALQWVFPHIHHRRTDVVVTPGTIELRGSVLGAAVIRGVGTVTAASKTWHATASTAGIELRGSVLGAAVIRGVGTVTAASKTWHATASTAGGEVLPSMEGLTISLRHTETIPEGTYLCDVVVAGKRARARVEAKSGVWLSAIYPREFTDGEAVPLPLHPGKHVAAWRAVKGATTDFLVGLEIEVPSSGPVRSEETFEDPMKG